ncbi:MAG: hypothetical protein GY903_28615 [Fuerstiella sp.]|nr:hypothetical protein [Fuerstiella sp.]MCP4787293.1 hypothetical protein [Fuerstiella sp.]MCP4858458.1 hypothetical protein [Fuerstiella sp.]
MSEVAPETFDNGLFTAADSSDQSTALVADDDSAAEFAAEFAAEDFREWIDAI